MHCNRKFSAFALLVACLFLPYVSADMLWIDKDCFRFEKFQTVLAETLSMAFKATRRLDNNGTDPYWEDVYANIFKTNETRKEVRDVFDGIRKLNSTSDDDEIVRKDSSIRLYCDENKRWKLQPDRPTDKIPNSKRAVVDKVYWDEDNDMVANSGVLNECGPKSPNLALAYTNMGWSQKDQNASRSVVTICKAGLSENYLSLELNKDTFFNRSRRVDDLRVFTSLILLHELTHCRPWGTWDIQPNPYGWHNVNQMDGEWAVKNADSYALMGILAPVKDLGYEVMLDPSEKGYVEGALFRASPRMSGSEVVTIKSLEIKEEI